MIKDISVNVNDITKLSTIRIFSIPGHPRYTMKIGISCGSLSWSIFSHYPFKSRHITSNIIFFMSSKGVVWFIMNFFSIYDCSTSFINLRTRDAIRF